MNNLKIKRGDSVIVIAGKDKGKKGKVIAVDPSSNSLLVKGINVVTKNQKAKSQKQKSTIIKTESKINASNVQLLCTSCSKPTKISIKLENDKKFRVCKKCDKKIEIQKKQETKKKKNVKTEQNK